MFTLTDKNYTVTGTVNGLILHLPKFTKEAKLTHSQSEVSLKPFSKAANEGELLGGIWSIVAPLQSQLENKVNYSTVLTLSFYDISGDHTLCAGRDASDLAKGVIQQGNYGLPCDNEMGVYLNVWEGGRITANCLISSLSLQQGRSYIDLNFDSLYCLINRALHTIHLDSSKL